MKFFHIRYWTKNNETGDTGKLKWVDARMMI